MARAAPEILIASAASLAAEFARRAVEGAHRAVRERGVFTLAVPGGSIARAFFPTLDLALPWESTELFWGDERAVPADDPESNAGMASTLLPVGRAGARGWHPIEIGADLDAVVRQIEAAAGKQVVVLTTGDPLFYGTARYLCDRLGKERFEVTPHVSSMQLAFARVKENWDDAYLANLATQSLDRVVEKVRIAEKVGLFTTEEVSPAKIARALRERKIDYFSAYVCENLGSPDERVTQGELAEVAQQSFAPLNVMILVRKPDAPDRPLEMVGRRLFGNPDEAFLQSQPERGLLTPAEVRAIALAEMDLGPTSVVWDVGAGSGAVAIEAAQIASGGRVYAIEMDPEDHNLISANAERFGVGNLITLPGLIVQQEFPRRDFPRAVSLNVAINQLVAATGPSILGVLHDLSGSYRTSLMVCLVLQAAAAILVLFRPRASIRDV